MRARSAAGPGPLPHVRGAPLDERGLNEDGELWVPLTALVDDFVEEVPSVS